jgi:hypothetical protein
MDTIKVITNHRMRFNGQDVPAGSEVAVSPATALDVINARRGELLDPNDAQRLRKWATQMGARRDFTTGGY